MLFIKGTQQSEAHAMAISADLGLQLEGYVANLVKSGRYNSKSEVLREGVRLVQERETRLAVLDSALVRGLADAEQGRMTPASDVFDRLERKFRSMVNEDSANKDRAKGQTGSHETAKPRT
jgi:antitoxin ParD1/3/4